MVKALCTSGNNEVLKAGVHGAAGVIAAVMASYNFAAWCFRREGHLRNNAIVYSLAVAFELKQTLHHVTHITPAVEPVAFALVEKRCA